MAVWVSDIVGPGRSCNCKFSCHRRRINVNPPNTPLVSIIFPTTTGWSNHCHSSVVPRALNPKTGDQNSTTSSQKEDLAYVAKLVVGSFGGAGAIKYGSAVFPEITTPNLVLALAIIFAPVLVAVLLLVNESLRPKP